MSDFKTSVSLVTWTALVTAVAVGLVFVLASSFPNPINWELVVAALAAFVATYQGFLSYRFIRIDRAYSHSVYKSDNYLDRYDHLVLCFPELEGPKSQNQPPPVEECYRRLEEHDSNRRVINYILNHWGRFASEYYSGILDCGRSREVLRPQFSKFFYFFEAYFKSTDGNGNQRLPANQYRNLFRLADEWRR